MNGNGSNTKSVMAHELAGKFKSKSDFIKYFKECLQLYLPPSYMITK
jgi:hypothetical protein